MSKELTEYIDDYCKDLMGHTNWGYADVDEVHEGDIVEDNIIFHLKEAVEDDGEKDWHWS